MADIRRIVRTAAAWAAVLVVVPMVSEFFIRLADERGWYDHPSERLAQLSAALTALTQAGWFPWVAGATIGFAVGVWLDAFLKRKQEAPSPSLKTPAKRPSRPSFGEDLLTCLKSYAQPESEVNIRISSLEQKYIADQLVSMFALAGWKIDYDDTPLERTRNSYYEGIQVSGNNIHLIETIANQLRHSGCGYVYQVHDSSRIDQSSSDWKARQFSLRIIIGHLLRPPSQVGLN